MICIVDRVEGHQKPRRAYISIQSARMQTLPTDPSEPPQLPDELFVLVYDELRRLARSYIRNESGIQTLDATGLVHEAWMKLRGALRENQSRQLSDREFYAMVAQAMRRILIDRARRKKTMRHGGKFARLDLHDNDPSVVQEDFDAIALDIALEKLQKESPIHAEIVSLKFFAGQTNEQVAQLLGKPVHWVRRQWTYVKARLLYFMEQ